MKFVQIAALLSLAGTCAVVPAQTTVPPLTEGYLCCNMRTAGGWISDSNYKETGSTMLRAGTPVKVLGFGKQRINLQIGAQKHDLGNDYSRDLSMDEFAERYIVKSDPKAALASAPDHIQRAVNSARATRGMTREQVIMALGYPMTSENPHLDAKTWKYWLWTFSPYEVHFDAQGLVSSVTGGSETLRVVLME